MLCDTHTHTVSRIGKTQIVQFDMITASSYGFEAIQRLIHYIMFVSPYHLNDYSSYGIDCVLCDILAFIIGMDTKFMLTMFS